MTSIPDLYVSPLKHSDPAHPAYLPEVDPELLSPSSCRALLKQSLFLLSQWCQGAQTKLFYKENKPKTTREKLASSGKRHMTVSQMERR